MTALDAILEAAALDRDAVRVGRGHLHARVSPMDRLGPGERWRATSDPPRFTVSWGADEVASGPCRRLGTWEGGRLSLAADLAHEGFDLDGDMSCTVEQADTACAWIAWKTGWHGAYEVREGGRSTWLALRLDTHRGQRLPDPAWCSFCGQSAVEVELVDRCGGTALCRRCRDHLEHLVQLAPPGPDDLADADAVPCMRCGSRGPRLFGAFNAVCLGCIDRGIGR